MASATTASHPVAAARATLRTLIATEASVTKIATAADAVFTALDEARHPVPDDYPSDQLAMLEHAAQRHHDTPCGHWTTWTAAENTADNSFLAEDDAALCAAEAEFRGWVREWALVDERIAA